jgi:hypothetical protein
MISFDISTWEVLMADVLIRGVDPDDLASLDAKAERLGLSRAQYLRRLLHEDAATTTGPVTVSDLQSFSETYPDLADEQVQRLAWS